ncbi:hypothetical protein quinque_004734 [Culex quinquefasciatus]
MDHEQQTAQFAELMQDIRRINIDGETIELTYHLRKFAEIFQRYISDDRTLRPPQQQLQLLLLGNEYWTNQFRIFR